MWTSLESRIYEKIGRFRLAMLSTLVMIVAVTSHEVNLECELMQSDHRRTLIRELCHKSASRFFMAPEELENEVLSRIWNFLEIPPSGTAEEEVWEGIINRAAKTHRKKEQRARRRGPPSLSIAWEREVPATQRPEQEAQFQEVLARLQSEVGPIEAKLLAYLVGETDCRNQTELTGGLGLSPKTVSKHKGTLGKKLAVIIEGTENA